MPQINPIFWITILLLFILLLNASVSNLNSPFSTVPTNNENTNPSNSLNW